MKARNVKKGLTLSRPGVQATHYYGRPYGPPALLHYFLGSGIKFQSIYQDIYLPDLCTKFQVWGPKKTNPQTGPKMWMKNQ